MDLDKNLTGPRFGPRNRLKGHSLGRAEGVDPPGHHGLVWHIVARGHQVASLRGILRIALQMEIAWSSSARLAGTSVPRYRRALMMSARRSAGARELGPRWRL